MLKRYTLLLAPLLSLLVACTSSEPPATPTSLDSFGANPNPAPANIPVVFSWSVTGDGVTCSLDVDNNGTTEYAVQNCSSGSKVSHVYGVQGSYAARLTVTGTDGKTLQRSSPVSVLAPNTPPNIPSLVASGSPTDLLAVRFTWVVDDANSDITHCRFDANSDGVWEFDRLCSGIPAISTVGKASIVTHTFTYTYPEVGRYTATLEAADPFGMAKTTIPVRVPWNRNPIITSFAAVLGNGLTGSVRFAVSDPDGDPLTCTLTVQGIGRFIYNNCGSATRSYTFPSEGEDAYQIKLEVVDTYQGVTSKTASMVAPLLSQFVSGDSHVCKLFSDRSLYCWGQNWGGQLGNGTTTDSSTPVAVSLPDGVTFIRISAGPQSFNTCALGNDSKAYCWGYNWKGQLGNGTTTDSSTPVAVSMPARVAFTQISVGGDHTCALGNDKNAYCWGANNQGSLGNGGTTDSSTPVAVSMPGGVTFTQISAGGDLGLYHTCALGDDKKAYCWGSNSNGQLGDGTTDDSSIPVEVSLPGGVTFTQISTAGYGHTCALGDDKKAYCWGYNDFGQLGDGTIDDSSIPVEVSMPVGVAVTQISSGWIHTCAIGNDNNAYCWGYNSDGQLGNGTTTAGSSTPVAVTRPASGRVSFTQMSAGDHHNCALGSDDNLYCWGWNNGGQLGDGTTTNSTTPVFVVFP